MMPFDQYVGEWFLSNLPMSAVQIACLAVLTWLVCLAGGGRR